MKIIDTTKQVLRENKVYKFLAIGGGVAAIADTFVTLPLMGIAELGGQVGGAVLLNKVMAGNQSIQDKSKTQVVVHMGKSAFLFLGSCAATVATHILPLDHITGQVIRTGMMAGALGFTEGAVSLYKNRNNSVALEQQKEANTQALFNKQATTESQHSDAYIGMRNRGFKSTEQETEESALGLSKTFKKR